MGYLNIISNLEDELRRNEDFDYAEKMSAYMKGHFLFFGIRAKKRQEIAKPYIKQLVQNHRAEYWEIAEHLWEKEERDFHYICIEFLKKTDRDWTSDTIRLLYWLTTNHAWWDTVDFIASHLVAKYVQLFSKADYAAIMDSWNEDNDMWVIRTSILFQLKYKKQVNWQLLQHYIHQHEESSQFFIRKAIGWILREYSKTEPDRVIEFIQDNPQLSNLSKKEGMKWVQKK